MKLVRSKKGAIISDETIKWIGIIALLTVCGFAVWRIVSKVMS